MTFFKKVSTDALAKTFQSLVSDKNDKKHASANSSNYNSISNQLKKATEPSTAIKAIRKMPITPQTPSSILSSQNRKKVSSKKDVHPNQNCIVISKITPSPK